MKLTPEERSAAVARGWVKRQASREANLLELLLSKADRSGGDAACWPWQGRIHAARRARHGAYGVILIRYRPRYVHRLMLEISLGRSLERGEQALHHCDFPRCINPAHLWVGTQADNLADMRAKKRDRPGGRNRYLGESV